METFRLTGDSAQAVQAMLNFASATGKVNDSILTMRGTLMTVDGYLRRQKDRIEEMALAQLEAAATAKRLNEVLMSTPEGKEQARTAELEKQVALIKQYQALNDKIAASEQRRIKNKLMDDSEWQRGPMKQKEAEDILNKTAERGVEIAEEKAAAERKVNAELQKRISIIQSEGVARARANSQSLKAQYFRSQNFGNVPGNATPQEVANYGIASSAFDQAVVKSGISTRQLIQLWAEYRAGIVQTGAVQVAMLPALRNLDQAYKALGSAAERSAERQAAAARNAASSVSTSYSTSEKAGRGMLLTWGSMVRLMTIQTLHMALGRLTHALFNAGRQFTELTKQISEIRIISLDAQYSFESWEGSISRLSSTFGKSTKDVAEGFYQLISNQTAKGAEAIRFMAHSLMFARTAVTSVTTAVELGSSAVNAYGYSASQANEFYAMFMKTIELGRLRAEDMNQHFGRAASQAKILGVEMHEFLAIYSVLTKKGVDSAEAMTLFNEIVRNMLKPTKEMKAWFREQYGTESVSAIIQMRSMIGLLRDMEVAANASGNKLEWLAELFSRARGMRGGAGLFTEGTMNQVVSESGQILRSPDEYAQKTEEALNPRNFTLKFQQMAESFKNYLTLEVIGPIMVSIAKMSGKDGLVGVFMKATAAVSPLIDAIKGITTFVSNFTGGIQQAVMAIVVLRTTWRLFAVQSAWDGANMTRTFTMWGMGIKRVGMEYQTLGIVAKGTMMGIQLATSIITSLIVSAIMDHYARMEEMRMQASHAGRELDRMMAEYKKPDDVTKAGKKSFFVTTEEVRLELNKQYSVYLEHVSKLQILMNRLGDVYKQIWENIAHETKNSFEAYYAGLQRQLDDIEKRRQNAEQGEKEGKRTLWDAQHKGKTEVFAEKIKEAETSADLKDLIKAYADYRKYLDETITTYATEAIKTGDPEAIAKVRRLYNEAATLAKNYHATLNKLKDEEARGYKDRVLHGVPSARATDAAAELPNAQKAVEKIRADELKNITDIIAAHAGRAAALKKEEDKRKLDMKLLRSDFAEYEKLLKADPMKMPGIAEGEASLTEWVRKSTTYAAKLKASIDLLVNDPELKKTMNDALANINTQIAQRKRQLELEKQLADIEKQVQEAKNKTQKYIEDRQKADAALRDKQTQMWGHIEGGSDMLAKVLTAGVQFGPNITTDQSAEGKPKPEAINAAARRAYLMARDMGYIKGDDSTFDANAVAVNIHNAANAMRTETDPEKLKELQKTIQDNLELLDLVRQALETTYEKFRASEPGKNGPGDGRYGMRLVGLNLNEYVDKHGRLLGTGRTDTGKDDQTTFSDRLAWIRDLVDETVTLAEQRTAQQAETERVLAALKENAPKLNEASIRLREDLLKIGDTKEQTAKLLIGIDKLITEMRELVKRFPAPPEPKALGGLLTGGISGRDSIPIMAMPGEYIVNARATANFLPELEAINRGQGLRGFAAGGYISNNPATSTSNTTSVGNIYVTVQGGDTSEQTVQNIATQLRRELRRGTISLS